jgi:hypothetical protein
MVAAVAQGAATRDARATSRGDLPKLVAHIPANALG